MERKYELTNESKDCNYNGFSFKLYRIRALKDFRITDRIIIYKGDLGGWIEKEENLSHNGNCWIQSGEVYGNGKVSDDALICSSVIRDNAFVGKETLVVDSTINGNVVVKDNYCKFADLSGNLVVDDCIIYNSKLSGNANLEKSKIVLSSIEDNVAIKNSEIRESHIGFCTEVVDSKLYDVHDSGQNKYYDSVVWHTNVAKHVILDKSHLDYCEVDSEIGVIGKKIRSEEVNEQTLSGKFPDKCAVAVQISDKSQVIKDLMAPLENLVMDVAENPNEKTTHFQYDFIYSLSSGKLSGQASPALKAELAKIEILKDEAMGRTIGKDYGNTTIEDVVALVNKIPYDENHCVENGWLFNKSITGNDMSAYSAEGTHTLMMCPTKIPGVFVRQFDNLESKSWKRFDVVFVDATKIEKDASMRSIVDTLENLHNRKNLKRSDIVMDKNFSDWEKKEKISFKEVYEILEKHGFSLIERDGKPIVKDVKNKDMDLLFCKTKNVGEIGTRLHYAIAGGAFDYDGTVRDRVLNVLDDFSKNKSITKSVDDFYNKFERRMEQRVSLTMKKKPSTNEMDNER